MNDNEDIRPRAKTLSFMASMALASGYVTACEGYLLEMLAWCAFSHDPGTGEPATYDL